MSTTEKQTVNRKKPVERLFLWFIILATVGIVTAHLFFAIVRHIVNELPVDAWTITLGVIGLAAIFTFVAPRLSHILPEWLDGSAAAHPVKASLFVLLGLLTIVQIARISTFKADPNSSFWVLTPDETDHECGTSYFYAIELHDRGEQNIYLSDHYPALNRDIEPQTEIEGMNVEDAYQYPPQFLLLPKLLLTITHDFPTIRIIWFSLQIIGIAIVFLLLAHWVGEVTGRWMAILTPLVIVSPCALYAFQYTQFHFIAIALAIAGMLAFEKNYNALGGALLAIAILGKIFPVFLLILLLAKKRWKPLAWTALSGVILTLATLVIFGAAPFSAFINYQLPRIQSFAAFAFLDIWPELRTLFIADNFSPYGEIVKLSEMGIPGMTKAVASGFNIFFTVSLIGLTIYASYQLKSRVRRIQIWLAVVGLGSITSPAAWGDYIFLPAIWLLTTLAAESKDNRKLAIWFGICWIFFYILLGSTPLSTSPLPIFTYSLSIINFILLISLLTWILVRNIHLKPKLIRNRLEIK